MLDFKEQVAVVTGGSRGIGRSIVETLASRGAKVVFTYAQSAGPAEELVAALSQRGYHVSAAKVDSGNFEEVSQFVELTQKSMGRIDILVNNAGIIKDTLILTMSKDDWGSVINTNLNGAYHFIKPIARVMLKQRHGSIVNLSSIVATKPGRGHSNYAASKGAIESMTKAIAAELGAKNIRVNAVAPGMIETDMSKAVRDHAGEQMLEQIALRRLGKPEDIAHAVAFLCSDQASYITGTVLAVDGGM